MHCNIGISGKQRSLNFCREQSFSPVAQVRRATFVSFRHYDFGFDLQVRARRLNSFFNQMGLCSRQLAAARA
jgi:hypothetical protein